MILHTPPKRGARGLPGLRVANDAEIDPQVGVMHAVPHRTSVSMREQIVDLAALRDRLRAEAASLDVIIGRLLAGDAERQRALARYELGEVWGATKLGLYLGVSRNTAYKKMKSEMAGLVWTDREGRLRVNAADVDRWARSQADAGQES